MASRKKTVASPKKGAKRSKAKTPNKKAARRELVDDESALSVLDGPMKSIIRQAFLR